MHAIVAAGAGFLLAVLWFDLMFDVQTGKQTSGELSAEVLGVDCRLLPARGGAADPPREQSRLARQIYRDHQACFAAILALLVLQLTIIGRPV